MFQWFHASASREIGMGDVIGDHTETHPMMASFRPAAQRSQIVDQTQWVHKYGGPIPRLWRPPTVLQLGDARRPAPGAHADGALDCGH